MTNKIGDFNKIVSNKSLFYQTVYTPLSEAIKILEERQKDKKLIKKIEELLKNDIPEPLKELGRNAVQFRQIATPNYDARCFIDITKDFGFKINFFEYHQDIFTSNNDFKHSLVQLKLHKNKNNKHGDSLLQKETIVDFNKYNGKKFLDIKTFWLEPLIDFHRRMFDAYGYCKDDFCFYDASVWFKRNGGRAINYYKNILLLFICHGILFENFVFSGKESEFTKKIFLPAFKKVIKLTKLKPLIVPIPPMDMEDEEHWISHDFKIKPFIKINK